MKVYISIPITGHDEQKQREKADLTKAMLSRAGHKVVSPFDIPCVKHEPEWIDYICTDLRVLHDCDAIYLCDGWQFSRGCRIEANFAKEFDKHIMFEKQPEELSEYYFER